MLRMPSLNRENLDLLLASSRLLYLAEATIAERDGYVAAARQEAQEHAAFLQEAGVLFAKVDAMS